MSRGRVYHRDCSYVEKDPMRGQAKQEFRDSSNINVLIAKYRKLGVWPSGSPGVYDDEVTWPKHLGEAFAITARAAEQFEALPATVRRRLGNDPRRLLDLDESDLKDLRSYYRRQEALKAPAVVQEPEGGRPSDKAPKAPKSKAKPESDDQE